MCSFLRKWFEGKRVKVLMFGLDFSGKTTILKKLKENCEIKTLPTFGVNMEEIKYRRMSFSIYDFGDNMTTYYSRSEFFPNGQAIIFVVDSSDRQRIEEAKYQLQELLQEEQLKDCLLLVFANKQDMYHVMDVEEVTRGLGLTSVTGRTWSVFSSSVIHEKGFREGFEWLHHELNNL